MNLCINAFQSNHHSTRGAKPFCSCHSQIQQTSSHRLSAKETIETLLKRNNIGATLRSFQDSYFYKDERGQEVDKVWAQIDILEKRHYVESNALLVDRTTLEQEVRARGLSLEDSHVQMRSEQLDAREKAQSILMEKVMQLRNSVFLSSAIYANFTH